LSTPFAASGDFWSFSGPQDVLHEDEPLAGLAERVRRLLLADPVDVEPLLADAAGQPGEIAVGTDQHEAVEAARMHQVHRVDHQRDVGGVLAHRIGGLMVRHDPELRLHAGPALHVA
jgi:hypothetical protein